jgi:hypothetical protein
MNPRTRQKLLDKLKRNAEKLGYKPGSKEWGAYVLGTLSSVTALEKIKAKQKRNRKPP